MTKRHHLLLGLLALIMIRAAAHSAEQRSDAESARVIDEFEIAKDAEVLLLPVVVNGKHYRFMLDTGSTMSEFDTTLRSALGPRQRTVQASTPAGDVAVELFGAPPATIGRQALRVGTPVFCNDLTLSREASGAAIYGSIGMDFLIDKVVQIDCDRSKLLFLTSPGPNAGERFRMRIGAGGVPLIVAEICGHTDLFMIDSGFTDTGSIDSSLFNSLLKSGQMQPAGTRRGTSLAGDREWVRGRADRVSLGEFTHRDLVLDSSKQNILGLEYWFRYIVTLDFPNRSVFLKQSARYGDPNRVDLSGLHIGRRDNTLVLKAVDVPSPAKTADLREGDVIESINDTVSSELSLGGLRRQLTVGGQSIRISVRRGESTLSKTVIIPASRSSP